MRQAISVALFALVASIVYWAWNARVTHDEGYMLDSIAHFPSDQVFNVIYNGRWGVRWLVTTGPTVSLPLALLATVGALHVVVARLVIFASFLALLVLGSRAAGLPARTITATVLYFLLWVLCMVWLPNANGSSLNLIANVFGEGISMALALLTIVLAARDDRRSRDWAWICALVAIGAKLVAALAVIVPLGYLVLSARRKKSPLPLGTHGLIVAAALFAVWQVWQLQALGANAYLNDWLGFFYWAGKGGGFKPNRNFITLPLKLKQLRESHVNPYVVIAMCVLGAGAVYAHRKLFKPMLLKLLAASLGVYFFWYAFLSSRGWMRHLWVGYALLGWAVAYIAARLLERRNISAFAQAVALGVALFSVATLHGSLPSLGRLPPSDRWQTQAALAEALSETFPQSRLFVYDWKMVPHIAYFMNRPQHNLVEHKPQRGDLILCDEESAGCDSRIAETYCSPEMTEARVAFCQF